MLNQMADSSRSGVKLVDTVLFNHLGCKPAKIQTYILYAYIGTHTYRQTHARCYLPVAAGVRVGGDALKDEGGGAVGQRAVHNVCL